MRSEETGGPERDEIRALLELAGDRDLTELEAKRLEAAFSSDPAFAGELLEDPAVDQVARGTPVPLPDDAEWDRLRARLAESVGPPSEHTETGAAPSGPVGVRTPAWRSALTLAAAAALCVVVARQILQEGMGDPPGPPPIAEVLDLPENSETFILTPEDEDGGVMIFVTSG